MLRRFALLLATIAATASLSTADEGSGTGSAVNRAQADRILILHNEARRAVGVMPVGWSPELAKYAQDWADELAKTGKFEHRPDDGEWKRKYGENIAIGFGSDDQSLAGVQRWIEERKDYDPEAEAPAAEAEFKAGHYTQVVWKNTKRIGVGMAVIQTGERKGWTVVVANYDPPGNVTGEKPF